MTQPVLYPTFKQALVFWLKLGFISFGGPAGQIAIMHEYLVEKKKWISESKFLHALNYCMLLPGPEAQQLATYSGWMLHGVRGGVAAGLLFILPSTVILWGLSFGYVLYGSTPMASAIFEFLKPAVVAIVLTALFKIWKKSLTTSLHYGIAVLAFISIYYFKTPFPLIVLGALLTGAIVVKFIPLTGKSVASSNANLSAGQPDHEAAYVINTQSNTPHLQFTWKRLGIKILFFTLLWIMPLIILFWTDIHGFEFWQKLSLFFTKSAFVTIGGAYAVLPYVAQVSVETFNWLTTYQMIDGLALGETTPGPLIMVLAFVGFMAGFNSFDRSIWMATLGLGLTVFYTFLPSFLFILAGAPFIERTQTNPYIKSIIGFTSAAITGVILNLAVYFATAIIFPEPSGLVMLALFWTLLSIVILQYFKVNMILWIGISLGIGIIKFILQGL